MGNMLRKLDDLASQAAAQKMQPSMIFSPYVLQIESGQIEANFENVISISFHVKKENQSFRLMS